MAKNLDYQKHTLNLRKRDFDRMGELFPQLGPSKAIRELISKFVDKHTRKELEE